MERELIIRSTPSGVEIALLEDSKLVELHQESEDSNFQVGDIYLGRVKRINPGLNAAFVDVGYKRDAFLHYTDLSPNIKSIIKFTQYGLRGNTQYARLDKFPFEPKIVKTGRINNAINKKNPVLVQILKEPISTKGPRLTCEITLAGRYIVLVPFGQGVGISRKIASSEERKRLVRLMESIKPGNFGVVIRTIAKGKKVAELHEDLNNLVQKWEKISKILKGKTPPKKIIGELDKTSTLLRDLLNESFSKIVVNDQALQNDIKNYVAKIAPGKENIVSIYKGRNPIFDSFGITKQVKSLFGKTVTTDSGAYLVIEHTEAMHVIDVNSGQRTDNNADQETNAFNVNVESAEEIARQLRLRDLGGIIIIDFIDMKNPANKKKLIEIMRKAMALDRAKHTILNLSKFGLMQITRQRVRPELNIVTSEVCPTCGGSGKIGPAIVILDEIERKLEYLFKKQNHASLKLYVHAFLYAYLKDGILTKQLHWWWKYRKWVKLYKSDDFNLVEYHFFDKNDEEININ